MDNMNPIYHEDGSTRRQDHGNNGFGQVRRKSVITSSNSSSGRNNVRDDTDRSKRNRDEMRLSDSSSDEDESSQKGKQSEPDTNAAIEAAAASVLSYYNSKPTSSEGESSQKKEHNNRKRKHASQVVESKSLDLELEPPASKVQHMMSKMGYKSGKGLGKNQQGIVDPIEPKGVVGKSGIGFSVIGLEPGRVEWDFDAEKIMIEEIVEWVPPSKPEQKLMLEQLLLWRTLGIQKMDISDATDFCRDDILELILQSKTVLDKMDNREFGRARFRSNPFEKILKAIFMNRAALKMANMDAILGFELTNPKIPFEPQELFYFAADFCRSTFKLYNALHYALYNLKVDPQKTKVDRYKGKNVCAGPGGFSEYVLWRKGWNAKGFGFTLKGENDFNMHDFVAGTPESFEPFYGVNDDGDVFNPLNIQSFIKYVKENTDDKGVHLMMADGGFSVDGQENIQEILSKQLYLSEFVVAIAIVRHGGSFVCKLFDIFTTFSVGLIYLLRTCFDQIAIHKPNTSRPANSERFILCIGKRSDADVQDVLDYLLDCHELMWNLRNSPAGASAGKTKEDILEVVPLSVLVNDEDFHSYIYKSNNELGERQIQNLQKIVAFYRDNTLVERRQHDTKVKCLEFWRVPMDRRKGFQPPENPQSRFHELIASADPGIVRLDETELVHSNMSVHFKSPWDWAAVLVGNEKSRLKRGFYISLGGTKVFRYSNSRWEPAEIRFDLPKDTLVYGEIVDEILDVTKPQSSRRSAFHIIDGMILGGKDVGYLNFWDRHKICKQFANAMNKPSTTSLAAVRVKEIVAMEDLTTFLSGLDGHATGSKVYLPLDPTFNEKKAPHLLVGGLLFLKVTNDPWMIAMSRSQRKLYFYNTCTRTSIFEASSEVYADFKHTMNSRMLWLWNEYTNFAQGPEVPSKKNLQTERVHLEAFLQFIKSIPI